MPALRRFFAPMVAVALAGAATPAATQSPSAGDAVPPGKPPAASAAAPSRPEVQGRPNGRAAQTARRTSPGNLVGHGGPVKAIAVATLTGDVLTGSFDYSMMVWAGDTESPSARWRLDHDGAVNAVLFATDAESRPLALSAGDDGDVNVSLVGSAPRQIGRLKGHTAKVVALARSGDGRLIASASWDRTARLWDLATMTPGPVLQGHQGPVNAVAFSADGEHVYTAGADGTVRLWRIAGGEAVRIVHKHGWGINVLARVEAASLEWLIFGALNGTVAIVDPASGDIVRELEPHDRPVLALAKIERPGLVASAGGDGMIRVSRIDDGAVIERYTNPTGPIWALAFAADGTALYYGGLDDFVTRWRISPRQPFEPIASEFPRRFQVAGKPDSVEAEGEVQFARKCSICHTLTADGANRAGPTLYRLFGRKIGTLPGYPFSDALKRLDLVWSERTVNDLFELGPDVVTPGSKMPLQVMSDARQRAALIAYMKAAGAAAGPDDAAPPTGTSSPATKGESKQ